MIVCMAWYTVRRSLRICRPKKILLFLFIYWLVFILLALLSSQYSWFRNRLDRDRRYVGLGKSVVMISKIHAIENSALFRVCVCGHECEYDKVVTTDREYELTDIKYRKLSNDSRLVLIWFLVSGLFPIMTINYYSSHFWYYSETNSVRWTIFVFELCLWRSFCHVIKTNFYLNFEFPARKARNTDKKYFDHVAKTPPQAFVIPRKTWWDE